MRKKRWDVRETLYSQVQGGLLLGLTASIPLFVWRIPSLSIMFLVNSGECRFLFYCNNA